MTTEKAEITPGTAESPMVPVTDWLWCEWAQPHPPHLWAERDPDEGTAIFACSGEGDE
jgi:hypothetical protein